MYINNKVDCGFDTVDGSHAELETGGVSYLVQVSDGLRDEDGGVLLCHHPPITLGHAGELTRPGPNIMHCITSSAQNFIF